MSFWNTLKQKLRSFIPVSRTYMDNKLRELEKENKRQEKILLELQKNSQSMLELKEYVSQELHRRDDWGKRAAQVQREAKERQIWVIKCPAPEEKKIRWGDYAYAVALKRYLDRMGMYTIIDLHEDWDCEVKRRCGSCTSRLRILPSGSPEHQMPLHYVEYQPPGDGYSRRIPAL